jgi:hypothetical protein
MADRQMAKLSHQVLKIIEDCCVCLCLCELIKMSEIILEYVNSFHFVSFRFVVLTSATYSQ